MKGSDSKKTLSPQDRKDILGILKARFEKHANRHKGIKWADVEAKLEADPDKLWSLGEMERTSGEPDVVGQDKKTGEYLFFDCSAETPKGRVSTCYDREALDSRKEHKPKTSAVDMATEMGIELLTEEQYHELQKLGEFDLKTSSLAQVPCRCPETRRCHLRRQALRPRLHLPQWRAILLRCTGISRRVEGVGIRWAEIASYLDQRPKG